MKEQELITREITFCKDCYELKGEMCHNPDCVFCRLPMKSVEAILDALSIKVIEE